MKAQQQLCSIYRKKKIHRFNKNMMCLNNGIQRATIAASIICGAMIFQPHQTIAQPFSAVQINPFSLTGLGAQNWSAPTFADLDNDGDLDMMTGNSTGANDDFDYFENTTVGSTISFGPVQHNPFGLSNLIGGIPNLTFVDLDGDNRIDIIATDGDFPANIDFFKNIGTITAPAFAPVLHNPFGLSMPGFLSYHPTLADLDNDGDLDLMIGDFNGSFYYFENTGSATLPAFAIAQIDPFNLSAVSLSSPEFVDLDGDGDFDLMSGENSGNGDFKYYENTDMGGGADFGPAQTNPFGLSAISGNVLQPTFVDLDTDGDLDLMVGDDSGDFYYFENSSISTTVGDDSFDSPSIAIHPNPTSNHLTIDTEQLLIEQMIIIDVTGKTIKQPMLLNNNLINVTDLPKGIYFLKLITKEETITQRFIKN